MARSEIDARRWDGLVDASREGWLFHSSRWLDLEDAKRDRSFAVLDAAGEILAIAALRIEWTPALNLAVPRVYNGRAGMAFAPALNAAMKREVNAFALARIRSIGRRSRALVTQWETPSMSPADDQATLSAAGFNIVSYPSKVIDLTPAGEKIFANTNKGCRRDVRRADRMGVKIQRASRLEDVQIFLELYRKTMERNRGSPRRDESFVNLWNALAPGGFCSLLIARAPSEQPIAAVIILHYKDASYYHAAGSDPLHREYLGNTRLLWEAIAQARARGDKTFHLGPVPRREQVSSRAFSIGQFKNQFGGGEVPWRIATGALWPGLGLLMKGALLLRSTLRRARENA